MNVDRGPVAIKPFATPGDGRPSSAPRESGSATFQLTAVEPLEARPKAIPSRPTPSAVGEAAERPRAAAERPSAVNAAPACTAAEPAKPTEAGGDASVQAESEETAPSRARTRLPARAGSDTDAPGLPGLMLALLDATPAPPDGPRGEGGTPESVEPPFPDARIAPPSALAGSLQAPVAPVASTEPEVDAFRMGIDARRPTVAPAAPNVSGSASAPAPPAGMAVDTSDARMPADTGISAQPPVASSASGPTHGPVVPPMAPGAFTLPGTTAAAGEAARDGALLTDAAVLKALSGTRPGRNTAGRGAAEGSSPTASPFASLVRDAVPLAGGPRVLATAPLSVPLALDAAFDDGLATRITWMADQRLERADIRVSPDGLGTIDIRLQMDGTRVHAQFQAAHPDVRQALESGMDRLRDLLGRQGMQLGQSQVGSGRGEDGRAGGGSLRSTAVGPVDAAEPIVTTVRLLRGGGLLDEYA